jgi:hypothetical protein
MESIVDPQQALLLEVLRRAAAAPVSFGELRRAGVELPASVVFELELAGVPLERCYRAGAGGERRLVGVRLGPEAGEGSAEASHATETPARPSARSVASRLAIRVYRSRPVGGAVQAAWTGLSHRARGCWRALRSTRRVRAQTASDAERARRQLRRERAAAAALAAGVADRAAWLLRDTPHGRQWRRALAPLALILCVGALIGVVATGLPTGGRPHRPAGARANRSTHVRRAPRATTGASRPAGVGTDTQRTAVSPALARKLEARGHALLVGGRYGNAVAVLQRAVAATGESPQACLEPSTDACFTYAYALYDLGRALRLSGDPAAAVPILERRLRIDNQRGTVAAELALAREQTG